MSHAFQKQESFTPVMGSPQHSGSLSSDLYVCPGALLGFFTAPTLLHDVKRKPNAKQGTQAKRKELNPLPQRHTALWCIAAAWSLLALPLSKGLAARLLAAGASAHSLELYAQVILPSLSFCMPCKVMQSSHEAAHSLELNGQTVLPSLRLDCHVQKITVQ
jgi:hypothetical protein